MVCKCLIVRFILFHLHYKPSPISTLKEEDEEEQVNNQTNEENMTTSIFTSLTNIAASITKKAAFWSNGRVFSALPIGLSQASLHQDATTAAGKAMEGMQQGMNDAMNMGDQMKENYSTDNVSEKAKDVSGKVAGTAQDVAEKAKQTMQEAWNSTKETAQSAKDAVMGKAEQSQDCMKETMHQSKDSVKAAAETVERSMNTKNRN